MLFNNHDMFRLRLVWIVERVPLLAAITLVAGSPEYRSASVDKSGQLHVILDSGKEVLPKRIAGQVAFGSPLVSPDHRTVGWLVMYPDPSYVNHVNDPLPVKLVIWEAGHLLHTFTTEQVFWDWQFLESGKRVAYSTGPTHGGAAEFVLRDVASGHVVARWRPKSGSDPPSWVGSLRG
jgi:hypothetical protein